VVYGHVHVHVLVCANSGSVAHYIL